MNWLFRLAGAIVYRIMHEVHQLEDEHDRESKVEHITIGLANGDEYVIEIGSDDEDDDDEDGPGGFEFGFRPTR
jgi:hypothetical protein